MLQARSRSSQPVGIMGESNKMKLMYNPDNKVLHLGIKLQALMTSLQHLEKTGLWVTVQPDTVV